MKEVHVDEVVSVLEKLFIDANYDLSQNVLDTLEKSIDREESPVGKEVLRSLSKMRIWQEMNIFQSARIQVLP